MQEKQIKNTVKEIRLFFNVRIALKQMDVHWVKETMALKVQRRIGNLSAEASK